jgi:site-specific DNA-methyltransferase (adenine-specific)
MTTTQHEWPPPGVKWYYADDAVCIAHGDCREIVPTLGRVDLVLTDPPYGEVNRDSGGLRNLDKGVADDDSGLDVTFLCDLQAATHYVWCGTEQVSALRAGYVAQGYSTRLCGWEKSNPSPMNGEYLWLSSFECCVFARTQKATFNQRCASPIWRGPTDHSQQHPTQKPLWLFSKLISASTNQGDTILDPFAGSGTTGRAAKDLHRKAILIEREERYCEISARRMAQQVLPLGT